MASVWRTSSPVDMDHEYTSNTWPHSFEKNSAEVNCRPYDSRRRRLFPHRRPSIPIPISRNVTATSDSSLLASSPSRDDSLIDHQDIDSTTSSPRSVDSVATVNVRVISTSERPFSGTDPRVWEDARFCTPYLASSPPRSCSIGCPIQAHNASSKSMETSFSAPLYTDTPARGNLQWKSMAQFHTFGRRVRPRDRQSREVTARTSLVPIAVRQDWSGEEYEHMLGRVESSPNVPALEIASWDCTVKLSTVVTVADSGRLHIHHLAVLSVIMPKGKLHAERVNLSVLVANAFRYDQKRSLGPGQSSLLFQEDVSQTGFFPRGGVGLVIERDSCDLEKPLNLYFAFKYPSPHHFVMASLPTFRPKGGRSLSEVVFIAEPLPPLSLRTFTRDPLSSWKLYDHPVNQVTCYERIGLPQLYPAACQDDIQMSILELDPVRFGAIRESNLSSMVWNLDITIHKDLEEQLECRMSFFLEVGPATVLVSLVPHGWVPGYFIVDGRVATEKSGECWKNKEGQITISKTSRMTPGPIMVGTVWQGPPQTRKHDGVSNSRPLPQIVDRKMLGGRLTCGSDEIVLLDHLKKEIRTYRPVDGNSILLPTMDAGYRIHLRSITEAPSPKSSGPNTDGPATPPIPEDIQLPKCAASHTDTEVELDHERAMSRTATDIEPPKKTQRALLLPLFVLFLLVPGFLLFVGYLRDENNNRMNERDQYPSTILREGHRLESVVDVVGLEPLQPLVPVADNLGGIAKCEGWRDWLDYGSGWKGCVP